MNFLLVVLIGLVSIPLIAWVDGLILPKNFKCDYCNREHHWTCWVVPTFLEITLFLLGLGIGLIN